MPCADACRLLDSIDFIEWIDSRSTNTCVFFDDEKYVVEGPSFTDSLSSRMLDVTGEQ